MKVKICGLRRSEDAERAIALGASHVGIVLAQDSPRRASREQAAAIVAAARGRAEPVLVFRGDADDAVIAACDVLGVRRVQVHGADAERCAGLEHAGLLPVPVTRVPVGARTIPPFAEPPTEARPALLDGGRGGEGRRFSWRLLVGGGPAGVFVAGGLRPDNLRELLAFRPWGIDVSSGVERVPGEKDPSLLEALFEAVRSAEVLS